MLIFAVILFLALEVEAARACGTGCLAAILLVIHGHHCRSAYVLTLETTAAQHEVAPRDKLAGLHARVPHWQLRKKSPSDSTA